MVGSVVERRTPAGERLRRRDRLGHLDERGNPLDAADEHRVRPVDEIRRRRERPPHPVDLVAVERHEELDQVDRVSIRGVVERVDGRRPLVDRRPRADHVALGQTCGHERREDEGRTPRVARDANRPERSLSVLLGLVEASPGDRDPGERSERHALLREVGDLLGARERRPPVGVSLVDAPEPQQGEGESGEGDPLEPRITGSARRLVGREQRLECAVEVEAEPARLRSGEVGARARVRIAGPVGELEGARRVPLGEGDAPLWPRGFGQLRVPAAQSATSSASISGRSSASGAMSIG